MNVDKQKYLKLIKESEKLNQEGKSLWNSDKTKYMKLNQYRIFLWNAVFWESRNQYLQIIKSFISGTIDGEEFANQLGNLSWQNNKLAEMREANLESEMNLQFNPKSSGFRKIISDMEAHLETFSPELDDSESSRYGIAITEEYLRIIVEEESLLQICAYCKES